VVGIDVAKELMFATLANDKAEVLKTVKWRHPEQSRELVSLFKSLPVASISVAMEPTGTYGDALRCHLAEEELDVYRVSAKRVHDAREVYDGVPSSHDAKAAAIIAKLHVDGASSQWVEDRDDLKELNAAIRLMNVFDRQYQQNLNSLEALLARHWPEVPQLLELGSVTLLNLLSSYGDPARIAKRKAEAERLMRKASRGSLAMEKRKAVARSASETMGVPMVAGEVKVLKALATDALRARQASADAKKKVESLSVAAPSTGAMGEVVGKATAAVVVCKVGDPLSFSSAAAYEKSVGLNLKIRSSGKQKGRLKITKRGSGYARRQLYLAALRLIQWDPVASAWYQRKVDRDGGTKMKAVVAVMRKLTRALWHVARGNQFDSRKLFDAKRLGLTLPASA
jgi:transposase